MSNCSFLFCSDVCKHLVIFIFYTISECINENKAIFLSGVTFNPLFYGKYDTSTPIQTCISYIHIPKQHFIKSLWFSLQCPAFFSRWQYSVMEHHLISTC